MLSIFFIYVLKRRPQTIVLFHFHLLIFSSSFFLILFLFRSSPCISFTLKNLRYFIFAFLRSNFTFLFSPSSLYSMSVASFISFISLPLRILIFSFFSLLPSFGQGTNSFFFLDVFTLGNPSLQNSGSFRIWGWCVCVRIEIIETIVRFISNFIS